MGSIPCQEIFLTHFLLKKRNIARKLIFGSEVGIIPKFFNVKESNLLGALFLFII